MALEIVMFAARSDNFGYLLRDTASGRVAALDAPEEGAILEALEARGWGLDEIFITHHHSDHTEAIAPLKARFGVKVTGPRGEKDKIAGLDTLVGGGDRVMLGETGFDVIDVPGHTLGHIAYHAATDRALFSADALFSLGVGRMFEGTPEMMWAGLERLKRLDAQTRIYCGHEYTLSNARFALSVDPDNGALKTRAQAVQAQIDRGEASIPALLGDEMKTNPFLLADTPEMARRMGLVGAAPAAVFGALRKAKDNF